MLSIRRNRFRVCSAYAEIGSAYAQSTRKLVPCMLSIRRMKVGDWVGVSAFAEHTGKLVPRMLSLRENRFRVGSAYAETISSQKAKKLTDKNAIFALINTKFQKPNNTLL